MEFCSKGPAKILLMPEKRDERKLKELSTKKSMYTSYNPLIRYDSYTYKKNVTSSLLMFFNLLFIKKLLIDNVLWSKV